MVDGRNESPPLFRIFFLNSDVCIILCQLTLLQLFLVVSINFRFFHHTVSLLQPSVNLSQNSFLFGIFHQDMPSLLVKMKKSQFCLPEINSTCIFYCFTDWVTQLVCISRCDVIIGREASGNIVSALHGAILSFADPGQLRAPWSLLENLTTAIFTTIQHVLR